MKSIQFKRLAGVGFYQPHPQELQRESATLEGQEIDLIAELEKEAFEDGQHIFVRASSPVSEPDLENTVVLVRRSSEGHIRCALTLRREAQKQRAAIIETLNQDQEKAIRLWEEIEKETDALRKMAALLRGLKSGKASGTTKTQAQKEETRHRAGGL
jgi:cobalamin biosynthesis Mg chelatase CobN